MRVRPFFILQRAESTEREKSEIKQKNHLIRASADYPYGVDEIKATGLTAIKGDRVKSPRVSEAKVSLECKLVQKLELIEEYKEGPGLRAIIDEAPALQE